MAGWLKYKVKQPVSDRQPDDKSLLPWAQREVHPFLQQVRRVLNWAVDWLGKVAVDSTDTPGLLADKLVVDPSTMEATIEGEEGSRTLKLSAKILDPVVAIPGLPPVIEIPTFGDIPEPYPGPMTMVGEDYAGDPEDPRYALGTHSHPVPPEADPDPTTTATRLYPAKIVDPLNRGTFACCFLGPHFLGGNTPMLDGWTEIAPGVLEYPAAGPIPADWLDGVDVQFYGSDGYSTMVGKTVLAYYEGDTSEHGTEEKKQLLYVLEDTGEHLEQFPGAPPGALYKVATKPRLRRVTAYSLSSQWVQGMTFQCQAGTRYGTDFFTLDNASVTLGTTFIEWVHTEGPDYDWDDRYELLTGPQLSSRGASKAIELMEWQMASGDAAAPQGFETILGTPGVSVLPAGPYLFDIEQIWLDAVPSGTTTTLRVQLLADNGVTAPVLLTAESTPIGTTPGPLSFGYDDAGHTIGNTDRLVLLYWLHTDSVTPVRVNLRYNSAARGTRVTLPFEMAITGAADGDHQHTSNRDLADQHPQKAITPSPKADVTISAGVMPVVAYGSWANVTSASANLDAMDADGFPDHGEREVYFAVGCKLRSDQSTTGTNRPLRTYKGSAATYQEFTARPGATVRFRYRPDLGASGMWLITGVQQG